MSSVINLPPLPWQVVPALLRQLLLPVRTILLNTFDYQLPTLNSVYFHTSFPEHSTKFGPGCRLHYFDPAREAALQGGGFRKSIIEVGKIQSTVAEGPRHSEGIGPC